jgi:hypothetical protein
MTHKRHFCGAQKSLAHLGALSNLGEGEKHTCMPCGAIASDRVQQRLARVAAFLREPALDLGGLEPSPFWKPDERRPSDKKGCPYYLLFVYVVARIVLVTDGVYPRNDTSGGMSYDHQTGRPFRVLREHPNTVGMKCLPSSLSVFIPMSGKNFSR